MPHVKGLKRSLPKPTAALAIDEDATSRETFPDDAHTLTRLVKEGLDKHADATEAVVHAIRGGCDVEAGKYVMMDCSVDEDAVSRLMQRLCERNVRRPFEKKALVHTYHLDSMSYAVEHRQATGEKKIRCWDERCCELDVRPSLNAAISFQRKDNVRPHSFPARADVHHAERSERLSVDMSGNAFLQIDVLGSGEVRVCAIVKRTDYKFPYRAVCRAMTCLLAATATAAAAATPPRN